MNYRKIVWTAAPLLALPCAPAGAQSSVTVYGVMDAGVRYIDNGPAGSMKVMTSGNNASTRLGFRGAESLGGNVSATFNIETTVGLDTGSAGLAVPANTFWDRIATVGLVSTSIGDLRLGRDYTPNWLATAGNDPYGAVGIGSIANLLAQGVTVPLNRAFGSPATNTSTMVRTNNGVHYRTPRTLGGFYAHLMVSAGEGQPTSGGGASKSGAARLGFTGGPFDASYTTMTTRNTLVAGQSFEDDVIAGSYDFGFARLRAVQRTMKYGTDKQVLTMLGATAPLGPQGTAKLSWLRADQTGATAGLSANDASQIAAGYVYDLSKRTALYAHASRLSNKGQAIFTIPGGPAVSVANFGGRTSSAYEAGLRHAF